MQSHHVDVTFSWDLRAEEAWKRVDDQELRADWEAYRAAVLSPGSVYGALTISTGSAIAVVEDELWHAIVEICFYAPPLILDGTGMTYRHLSSEGELRFSRAAQSSHVEGDDEPDLTVESTSLVRSLIECGLRYYDLVERVKDDPNTYRLMWEMLSPLVPTLTRALERLPKV